MGGNENEMAAILKRIEFLENENKALRGEVQELKNNDKEIKAELNTINRFISAMTESQSVDEVMTEIESAAKQLTGSDSVTFYCMDSTNNKFFSENGGRQWNPRDGEDIKTVFETQKIMNFGNKAFIPLVTADGTSLGVLEANKKSCFDISDLMRNFANGGTFVENVRLGLEKEYQHQGRITDVLTQMYNRQGLNEFLMNTVVKAFNEGKCVSLLMGDIDHFKGVNDTHGHKAGDEILKCVAGVLKDFTKDSESCCFRLGGEEMMTIIISDSPEEAVEAAEKIRRTIESKRTEVTKDEGTLSIGVTMSIGVHEMQSEEPITKENVCKVFDGQFKIADNAAYAAKAAGRNQVVCADDFTYMNFLAGKAAEIFIECEDITDKTSINSIYEMIFAASENPTEEQNLFTVVDALRNYTGIDISENMPEVAEMAEFIADKIEAFANGIESQLAMLSPKAVPEAVEVIPEAEAAVQETAQKEQSGPEQTTPKKHISDVIHGFKEWLNDAFEKLAEQDKQEINRNDGDER